MGLALLLWMTICRKKCCISNAFDGSEDDIVWEGDVENKGDIDWVEKNEMGDVACMGEERGVHNELLGKPEGKIPFGRPTCRWEDNIKMDFKRLHWGVGTG
jgi:hypothetical protein